jgi:mRNA interferase MazF
MVIARGDIWWASLNAPTGSEPGYRRPVLVIQADAFNRSRINTVIVAVITSNTKLARAPGNVKLERRDSGLKKTSVVNVSQVITLDKSFLTEKIGQISSAKQIEVDEGLKLIFTLY